MKERKPNWMSDKILEESHGQIDPPFYTKSIFLSNRQNHDKQLKIIIELLEGGGVTFSDEIGEIGGERAQEIVITALKTIKSTMNSDIYGVMDDQIQFPNDNNSNN